MLFDLGETAMAEVLWSRTMAVLGERSGWEEADTESRLGEELLSLERVEEEATACLREGWETLRRLRGGDAAVTRAVRWRWSG